MKAIAIALLLAASAAAAPVTYSGATGTTRGTIYYGGGLWGRYSQPSYMDFAFDNDSGDFELLSMAVEDTAGDVFYSWEPFSLTLDRQPGGHFSEKLWRSNVNFFDSNGTELSGWIDLRSPDEIEPNLAESLSWYFQSGGGASGSSVEGVLDPVSVPGRNDWALVRTGTVVVVPEPGVLALLGALASTGLAFLWRWRVA